MSAITTHVLDTARGRPASGVPIVLALRTPLPDSLPDEASEWVEIGRGQTDADGRLRTLIPQGTELVVGTYRITFDTGAYFDSISISGFYPEASIVFEVKNATEHYHVPLLLQPFGYSTYRGS